MQIKERWILILDNSKFFNLQAPNIKIGEVKNKWTVIGVWVNYNGAIKAYKASCICGYLNDIDRSSLETSNSKGCRRCASAELSSKMKLSMEELKHRVYNSHETDRYTYPYLDKELSDYETYQNNRCQITIRCKKHGIFNQRLCNHVDGKQGCPKCAGNKRRSLDELKVLILTSRLDNVYRYPNLDGELSSYRTWHNKITIICPKHGEFKQIIQSHIEGSGCPNCANYSFKEDKPAILYYINIIGTKVYKIGVTNKLNAIDRFYDHQQLIRTIRIWKFDLGKRAKEVENEILNELKNDKYIGPKLLPSGNTEMFSIDVLCLDYRIAG